jgi:hypothetical protein
MTMSTAIGNAHLDPLIPAPRGAPREATRGGCREADRRRLRDCFARLSESVVMTMGGTGQLRQ